MLIRYGYTIFIGILFATLVGVGISAFYKGPKPPEYPTKLRYETAPKEVGATPSADTRKAEEEYEKRNKDFQTANENYNKNVSIIALVGSILALVVSLAFMKQIVVLADGLLLGGLLTLIYSIIRGFSSNDDMYRFLVVLISFVIAVGIGYVKFIRPQEKK